MVDDRHLRVFLGDDQRVRKDRRARARCGVDEDDRLVDLDPAGDVDEGAVRDERLVERGELCRAELLRLRHEVLAQELRVLSARLGERGDDDALRREVGGQGAAGREAAVDEREHAAAAARENAAGAGGVPAGGAASGVNPSILIPERLLKRQLSSVRAGIGSASNRA